MTNKTQLSLDDEDYLIDMNAPNVDEPPEPRTWHEFLKELEDWESLDTKGQQAILELYGLEEGSDLNEEIPDDLLFERYAPASPQGIAYDALFKLEYNEGAKGVLEFWESPSIGSSFTGVKLVGTRDELRALLSSEGLDSEISVPLYIETILPKAKTQFVKDRLMKMVKAGNDDCDLADDLLNLEAYIEEGEPELGRFRRFSSDPYEVTLGEFPPESKEYQAIKKELG